MTKRPAPNAQPLPGLEQIDRPVSRLELAVRRTLAELADKDILIERHAAYTAMALELAEVISLKKAAGRLSTASNDFRELRELLDGLLPEDPDGLDPELKAALESWTAT